MTEDTKKEQQMNDDDILKMCYSIVMNGDPQTLNILWQILTMWEIAQLER
jgi:hypothetical protein